MAIDYCSDKVVALHRDRSRADATRLLLTKSVTDDQTNSDSYVAEKKAVAVATIFMSIPLLLSFNIKYQWFPNGIAYGFLFFWGLLSVLVVPALLAITVVLTLRIALRKTPDRSALKWLIWAASIGLIAEIIFIAARLSPPTL